MEEKEQENVKCLAMVKTTFNTVKSDSKQIQFPALMRLSQTFGWVWTPASMRLSLILDESNVYASSSVTSFKLCFFYL